MSFTTEITLWCDFEGCAEWVQFNNAEAQGHPRTARQLAKRRYHWDTRRVDGNLSDLCPAHNGQPQYARVPSY